MHSHLFIPCTAPCAFVAPSTSWTATDAASVVCAVQIVKENKS